MEKAQKGDLIRIVKVMSGVNFVEIGDIYEVSEVSRFGVHVKGRNKHQSDYVADFEYVIHRKAGEEDSPQPVTVIADAVAKYNERQDPVNPQHYKQGRVEVIDIIEDAVEGADPFEAVCQANVLKYALRYRHKNGVEDLKKAVWYAEKLIAYLDA